MMAESNPVPEEKSAVHTFRTMAQLTACIELSEQRVARAELALGTQTHNLFSTVTLLQGVYALFDTLRHFTMRRRYGRRRHRP